MWSMYMMLEWTVRERNWWWKKTDESWSSSTRMRKGIMIDPKNQSQVIVQHVHGNRSGGMQIPGPRGKVGGGIKCCWWYTMILYTILGSGLTHCVEDPMPKRAYMLEMAHELSSWSQCSCLCHSDSTFRRPILSDPSSPFHIRTTVSRTQSLDWLLFFSPWHISLLRPASSHTAPSETPQPRSHFY